MKIHKLDIPIGSKELYRRRLEKIKKNNLYFDFDDEKKSLSGKSYQSFGRVLHIRKLKSYTVVIFSTNGSKETIVLKGKINKIFLKNVRRNDYLYVLGRKDLNKDILISSFKVVSISFNLQGKKGLFLHERLINKEEDFLAIKKYSDVYSKINTSLRKSGYIEVNSKILQDSFYAGNSRPFETYSNDAHRSKYLRFSSEPILKEMLVGGMERVYSFV